MIGLLDFIEEHREAVAYDLLKLGLRLRNFPSPSLTYGDMAVIVRQSSQDSAIARSVDPEQSAWTLSDQLLALVGDYLAWIAWSKTADGEKGRNRPKPIPRPGVEPDEDVRTFGSDPVALDELDAFLGWAKERVEEQQVPTRPRDARGRFIKKQ